MYSLNMYLGLISPCYVTTLWTRCNGHVTHIQQKYREYESYIFASEMTVHAGNEVSRGPRGSEAYEQMISLILPTNNLLA